MAKTLSVIVSLNVTNFLSNLLILLTSIHFIHSIAHFVRWESSISSNSTKNRKKNTQGKRPCGGNYHYWLYFLPSFTNLGCCSQAPGRVATLNVIQGPFQIWYSIKLLLWEAYFISTATPDKHILKLTTAECNIFRRIQLTKPRKFYFSSS